MNGQMHRTAAPLIAPRPDRVSAGVLALSLHWLCLAGAALLILLVDEVNHAAINAFALIVLSFCFLGGGVGLLASGLQRWHLAALPEHAAPNAPTQAQQDIARRLSFAKTATALLIASGLGFFVSGYQAPFFVIIPALIGTGTLWFHLSGIAPRPGLSRAETRHRDAVWNAMPRVRRARERADRKSATTKYLLILMVPLFLIKTIVESAGSPGAWAVLALPVCAIAVFAAMVWPHIFPPKPDVTAPDPLDDPLSSTRRKF